MPLSYRMRDGPTFLAAVLVVALLTGATGAGILPGPEPSSAGPRVAGAPGPAALAAGGGIPVRFQLSATLNGTVGVALVLDASFQITSGSIDENTSLPGTVRLSAAPTASLELSGLGAAPALPVPTLGSYGPIPVPGVSYSYLGARLGLSVSARSSINATLSVGGGPATPVGWGAPGNVSFTVSAPDGSAGQVVPVRLGPLAYLVSVGLFAVGTVPFLGNVTVPIVPFAPLGNVSGVPSQATANWTVTAPPAITSFSANPAAVTVGSPSVLTVLSSGGSGPLRYEYSGLPPGCLSSNLSTFSCQSSTPGNYTVTVRATDPQGETTSASLVLPVGAAAARAGKSAPGGLGTLGGPLALGAAAAVAVAVGFLWGRRRRPARPPP